MKTRLFPLLTLAFVMLTTVVSAQNFPKMDKSPMDAAAFPRSHREANKVVKVIYSRPQLKGRTLDQLAPAGKVWRTGANEASEITFYKSVDFGGKTIPPGTYTLFAIPGKKTWTIILNSDLNVWGAYSYKKSDDVARMTATVTQGDTPLEAFSIVFDEQGTMHMGWGTVRVAVPIK